MATAPIPHPLRASLGLINRTAFNDMRNLRLYAHPTTDGRLVFGGRGAPYHFGSKWLSLRRRRQDPPPDHHHHARHVPSGPPHRDRRDGAVAGNMSCMVVMIWWWILVSTS